MTGNSAHRSPPGGWNLSSIVRDVGIAWRLFWDPSVPSLLKLLLPVLALIYWISPLDLIPGPFDDIAILLLAARLLPFATFAVRSARSRVDEHMIHAAAVAGLPPTERLFRVTIPLIGSGAALGLLLAFLFGLREVDALIFTRSGGETIPVQLYNMIHYGFDVQVAGLSLLWTAGVALLLGAIGLLAGARFRLLP